MGKTIASDSTRNRNFAVITQSRVTVIPHHDALETLSRELQEGLRICTKCSQTYFGSLTGGIGISSSNSHSYGGLVAQSLGSVFGGP